MKVFLSILLVLSMLLSCSAVFMGCDDRDDSDTGDPCENDLPNNEGDDGEGNPPSGSTQNPTQNEPPVYSEGLEFSVSEDRTYVYVTGMGTCEDKKVVIPPTYNDLPVKGIGGTSFGGGSFLRPNVPKITEIVIPDSVEAIGYGAFANNTSLKKITLGNSIKTIADEAFYLCKNLEEVHIGSLSAWCRIAFETETAHPFNESETAKLYVNGSEISELVIPDDVTELKKYAFYQCNFLTKVKIGDQVTDIKDQAFAYCKNLTDVEIGANVSCIEGWSFTGCSMLLRAVFKDCSGWSATQYDYGLHQDVTTQLSESDLSIPATAAAYLTDATAHAMANWNKES